MKNLPRLDLRLLRAAVTIRDSGSVTSAAKRLGISQPALSRLISVLEAELGFSIFVRERRRLVPAQAGLIFLDRAAAMVTQAGRLAQLGAALRDGQRPAIRILATPNLASGALQAALTRFADLEMEVQVALRFRPDLLRELAAGEADFGLTVLPVGSDRLRVRPYSQARAICLLPRGHPAARRRVVTPADLNGCDLAVLPEGAILQNSVDDAFSAAGAAYRRRFTVDTATMAVGLVAAGLCCSIMHPVRGAQNDRGLVVRPFAPEIRLTYALLERRDAGLDLIGDALEAALREAAASLDLEVSQDVRVR